MEGLPVVDPIPLPAPVWIFVALHTLTMVLHFYAVHFLIGGLALATVWGMVGRWRGDDRLRSASTLLGHQLPVVMTYVINLGVPPLLFTQVLYGRALYTSSVLIGIWWISVVALLIVSYSLLYIMVRRGDKGLNAAWVGLAALLVVMMIGMIYSTNMSLMLRPDSWVAAYRSSPNGLTFHTGDHTVLPRWLYMMLGSMGVSGLGLIFLGFKKNLPKDLQALFHRWGARFVIAFTAIQLILGAWALAAQPEATRATFWATTFYGVAMAGWGVTALVLIGLGVAAARRPVLGKGLIGALAGASFLNVTLWVLVRDGIRFAALSNAGASIWDRTVSTNWSPVILFLICFVAALGVMAWLVSVVVRAKPLSEPDVAQPVPAAMVEPSPESLA